MPESSSLSFPEMRDALLATADVIALRDDLLACAKIIGVLEKGAATAHARPEQPAATLTDAVQRLLAGQVRALQIRYAYDGHEWSDTLMSLPTGIRLVRCQHSPTVGIGSASKCSSEVVVR